MDTGEIEAPATKPRRKRPPAVLRRPVICVCNDVFAPALRPLRDVAQELRLRRVMPERLVRRLKAVCAQEGVETDRQVGAVMSGGAVSVLRGCADVSVLLWVE